MTAALIPEATTSPADATRRPLEFMPHVYIGCNSAQALLGDSSLDTGQTEAGGAARPASNGNYSITMEITIN